MKPSYRLIAVLIYFFILSSNTKGFQKSQGPQIFTGTFKEVFSDGETFLEGPAMSPDEILFFSDIPLADGTPGKAGIIWSLNPLTRESKVFRSPSGMSNGLAFDHDGNLIVCEGADFGGRMVTRTDMKTGKSIILAGLFQGRRFNSPNDVAIDEQGRVYFTDPRYVGTESLEQHVMGVYRIDKDGSTHLVAANVTKPNGIVISPDQKNLYVADCDMPGNGNLRFLPDDAAVVKPTGQGSIVAFNLLPDGALEFKSRLIDFGARGPDGMAIDAEGNLYIALGNGVEVFSSQGKKLAELKLPAANNLCFGRGRFSKTLFIAGGTKIYAIACRNEGYNIPLAK